MTRIVTVSLLFLMMVFNTFADEITLVPEQDAYICDCKPDSTNPNGGPNYLYQGQFGSCYDRTLIQWDISEIEPGSTIINAEMWRYCEAFYGVVSGEMVYYLITDPWDENTVTYNTQPNYIEDIQTVTGWPAVDEWQIVDVTEFVQNWFDGTYENYGIYCHSQNTTGTCVAGFYSSNYSNEELRPELVITYWGADLDDTSWGNVKVCY